MKKEPDESLSNENTISILKQSGHYELVAIDSDTGERLAHISLLKNKRYVERACQLLGLSVIEKLSSEEK